MNLRYQKGISKVSFIILLIAIGGLIAVYLKTDYLQQATEYISKNLLGEKDHLVTYYQWSSANGETVISLEKPEHVDDYITFQASADLMSNQNVVDPNLISQSNQYRDQVLSQQPKARTGNTKKGSGTGLTSPTSGTIFGAPAKARNCVNAAMQQGVANRKAAESGKQGNTDKASGC